MQNIERTDALHAQLSAKRRAFALAMRAVMLASFAMVAALVLGIVVYVLAKGLTGLSW